MLKNIDIIKRWFAFDITNMRFFEKSISKSESSDEIRKDTPSIAGKKQSYCYSYRFHLVDEMLDLCEKRTSPLILVAQWNVLSPNDGNNWSVQIQVGATVLIYRFVASGSSSSHPGGRLSETASSLMNTRCSVPQRSSRTRLTNEWQRKSFKRKKK